MDAKISQKALSLVTRAKAYHAQWEECFHGLPTYGYLCGIRGFDSQYGEPVTCVHCEDGDTPPFDGVDLYPWALATARGQRWEAPKPVFEDGEDPYA